MKCHEHRPIGMFLPDPRPGDGWSDWCSVCVSNRTSVKARKKRLNRHRDNNRAREGNRKSYAKNKERFRARGKASYAVSMGKIIPPSCCEICRGSFDAMHHEDYTRPLYVWFLCDKCHGFAHRLDNLLSDTYEPSDAQKNGFSFMVRTQPWDIYDEYVSNLGYFDDDPAHTRPNLKPYQNERLAVG